MAIEYLTNIPKDAIIVGIITINGGLTAGGLRITQGESEGEYYGRSE
jgi:hypothetical protein